MTNIDKFLALVSTEKTDTIARNKERIKNRAMLRESQQIALKVLNKLDELGWSKKDLAYKMEVTPQQITKIVSGKENLTIATQVKLQTILDIPILATYYENQTQDYENRQRAINATLQSYENRIEKIAVQYEKISSNYEVTKVIDFPKTNFIPEYSFYAEQ